MSFIETHSPAPQRTDEQLLSDSFSPSVFLRLTLRSVRVTFFFVPPLDL